jgi:hypothetical protein
MRLIAGAAAIGVTMLMLAAGTLAQNGPADAAAKISGTWKLNVELSPALPSAGRGGRGRSRGGDMFAMGLAAAQRGGRGGGGGREGGGEGMIETPPEEIAAQRVLRPFEQVPADLTITAAAGSVSFTEAGGTGTFAADGKTVELNVDGSKIKVKTKWDGPALRQEFWSTRRKVIRAWTLDPSNHLVLTMKVESLMAYTIDKRAVYDRQQ